MSYILSWNCRGLGRTATVNALKRIVFLERPQVMFLSETRLKAFEMEKIKQKIKFHSCFVVECDGEGRKRSGGLALLWQSTIDVVVSSYSLNHVDALVGANEHEEWRFMVIYGHPEEENKYKTGQLLESLRDTNEKSWLVEGDLNLMLHSHEKRGGRGFCFEVADILRKAVDRCQLEDLGFIGHEFTWTNNQGGPKNIQERLDRFLANHAWREVFMGSFVTHLTKRRSDHLPILLCIQKAVPKQKKKKKKKKLYHFEEMWLRDENCAEIVSEAWERGGDLCSKIAFTSSRLSAWSREKFGDFVKELNDC
ncbi:uncharacterized protein LOC110693734 [Chenopodium quinoa]|uniref:uncharacterized protein LOC110693734 n=1 Tax=Chenopodium quinoa TaxID=63459 RepID=UPI000B777759|nr:uncharacterized protein LOC110693734 [Chenopodium quinoa]